MDILNEFFEAVDPNGLNGAEAEITPQGIMVNDTLVAGKQNYKPFNQAQNISNNMLGAIKKAYKAIPDKSAVVANDTSTPDIQVKANGEAVINPEKGQSYRVQVAESVESNEIFDKILQRSDATSIRTTGKRSKMVGGNPRGESDLEDNYELDPETGVWTAKEPNKFGARTSFGESENLVESFFSSHAPYDYDDLENEVADRDDTSKPECIECTPEELDLFSDILSSDSGSNSENPDEIIF